MAAADSGAAGRPGAPPARTAARQQFRRVRSGGGKRPRAAPVDPIACRDLWRRVLLGVVSDLCALAGGAPGGGQLRARDRRDAEIWVGRWPSADFRLVCELAGLDPAAVHAAMLSLLSLPPRARAGAWTDWIRTAGGEPRERLETEEPFDAA